jgi:tetratricopeptide (TPR) repeat protein
MEFKSGPIKLSAGAKPRDPEADRATLLAIQERLHADDFEAAVRLGEAALADGLQHPMLYNLAAERLEAEGRFGEALVLLERGHALAPTDLGLRQALGLCLFRLQRFAQALPHFEALSAAQPDFAPGHAARGATLDALGDLPAAEAAYRRAIELEPENLLAIAGLASLASRVGRHPEARALAERVLAAEPGYPEAVIVLAKADLAEGQTAQAEARLRGMIADPRASNDQRVFAHGLLGDIPAGKGRTPDA